MIIIPIILLSLLLFRNSFSIYFFQDDWFALSISKINSLADFFHFFIPRPDVQFYRPLSVEIFYSASRGIFNLNPLGFHAIVWLFFIINIFLVYKLTQKFLDSRKMQLLFTFLYALSSIHYASLFWLANFSYILSGFWYFLGFIFFLEKDNSARKNVLLAGVFILGLLSNEFMITFPVMIFIYTLLFRSKDWRQFIRLVVILFSILIFYGLIRFFIFKPHFDTYQIVFDKNVISSYRWFFLFFLNWPETMKDQMLNFYKINPRFLQSFSSEFYIFLTNLLVFVGIFIFLPIVKLIRSVQYRIFILKNREKILFALLWFIINLLPIIFIPGHIYPHHGTIALFGFLALFLILFSGYKQYLNRYLYGFTIALLIISWVISSFMTVSLNDKIHWINWRSDKARMWVQRTKSAFPSVPPESFIQIPTEESEDKIALADGRAIKELYGDDSLNIIFATASSTREEIMVVP